MSRWQILAAAGLGLLFLALLMSPSPSPSPPSIVFTIPPQVALSPPPVRAGELASIKIGFTITRPECRNHSERVGETYIRTEGYGSLLVTSIAPAVIRPVVQTEQVQSEYTIVFRVPELTPKGKAWLRSINWRECSNGEEQLVRLPDYPLIIE